MRRLAAVLALTLVPSLARADIPPPNSTCGGKTAGAACTTDDGKKGTCTAQQCSRVGMLPDGGFGNMTYDCTICVAAADSTSGGSSSGGSSGQTPTGSSSGGSASSGGGSKSGCSAAPVAGSSPSGSALALALAAFLLVRRRRA